MYKLFASYSLSYPPFSIASPLPLVPTHPTDRTCSIFLFSDFVEEKTEKIKRKT
jgi:hypothetical protein